MVTRTRTRAKPQHVTLAVERRWKVGTHVVTWFTGVGVVSGSLWRRDVGGSTHMALVGRVTCDVLLNYIPLATSGEWSPGIEYRIITEDECLAVIAAISLDEATGRLMFERLINGEEG